MQWIFTDIPVSWIFQGGRHSKEMNWKESKTQQINKICSKMFKNVNETLRIILQTLYEPYF